MNLYNEVKTMFEISDVAMKLFEELKFTRKYVSSTDELYIYNNINTLELDYREMIHKHPELINYSDRKRKIIYFKNGIKVYLKTIYECTRGLDGYRFGKVKFRD